ncbi:hypothetical protein BQ8482_220192 [Mesorhizobium delmotii]|uniref:Uncharacterized protein n=1 Tax=Mesorhizobium delmotii TaxID=1631247 RepID=A0A2P9ALK3_9HYPH|nr:hypothetical protein BQ8482_220192 [Mesorhizobium delmotii]
MRAELSSGTVVVGVDSYLFSPLTRAHADFVARRLARKIFGFRRDSSARLWRSLRLRQRQARSGTGRIPVSKRRRVRVREYLL